MSATLITLKKLRTEGRLSIGDTLHHSERGDCELLQVIDRSTIVVKDAEGNKWRWEVDFGPGAYLAPGEVAP